MAPPSSPPLITDGIQSQAGQGLIKNTPSIRVEVGDASINMNYWIIPKNLLIHHSTFFARALDGSFLEAESRTIQFQDDNPKDFEHFVHWLYIGKMHFFNLSWTLGDKLECLVFSDCVMTCLINFHNTIRIGIPTIHLAYNTSAPNLKLRKWIVDQFLYDASDGAYEPLDVETTAEELRDCGDWGFDISQMLMRTSTRGELPWNPHEQGECYMETLAFEKTLG